MLEASKLVFPYKEFTVSPFPSSTRKVSLFRPIIPLIILYRSKFVSFEALIDSGADSNIFHGDIATYLGIQLTRGSRRNVWGISGGPLKGYEHEVTLRIKNIEYQTKITFSNQIPENTLAVLGNKGFFDRFTVTLDYKAKTITLAA